MQITDPISDLLTRIRNAQLVRQDVVAVPASKMKIAITHLLKEEGFVKNYKCIRDKKQGMIKIALKYDGEGHPAIRDIQRVSRPSLRIYKRAKDVPRVKNGFGIGIFSTSHGLMTDRQARAANLGGEFLCKVF